MRVLQKLIGGLVGLAVLGTTSFANAATVDILTSDGQGADVVTGQNKQ